MTTLQAIPPPLRLPSGSVRALMALILCGTLWYATLQNVATPLVLVESALLVVAFYFGVRSTAPLIPAQPSATAATVIKPAKPMKEEKGAQPLHLPHGSVRTILALGFLGVIAYVWFRDGRPSDTLVLVFQVIASYIVGYAFSMTLLRRAKAGKGLSRSASVLRNFISLAAIGITGGVCWAIATGSFDIVPGYLSNGLAWTVAFYFGSRLAP